MVEAIRQERDAARAELQGRIQERDAVAMELEVTRSRLERMRLPVRQKIVREARRLVRRWGAARGLDSGQLGPEVSPLSCLDAERRSAA